LYTYSDQNKNRIRELANQLRSKHGAMRWGITPEDLLKVEGVKCHEYDLSEEGFFKKLKRGIVNIAKKVKAALFVPEKLVVVDFDLHPAKKPFGKMHELGHNTIPEHRDILYVCSEHDLDPNVRIAMEFEANLFASEALYPGPLMRSIHTNYPLAMETILHLSELSGGSIHSSAIKYVETSDEVCALLTLEKSEEEGTDGLKLRTQIPSTPFFKKYKRIFADGQFISREHNLASVVFANPADEIIKTEITIRNRNVHFNVHLFYNRYIVLALVLE